MYLALSKEVELIQVSGSGTFLNFNSVGVGPLPSWCNRLPCPDKELGKNRQALPSFRRRLCKDFALRHQVPYYLSWTSVPWLVSSSHLHGTGRRPEATSVMLWDEVFIRLFEYRITECSCRRVCSEGSAPELTWPRFPMFTWKRWPLGSGTWSGSNKHTAPLCLPLLPRLIEWVVCNQWVEQMRKVPGNWPIYLIISRPSFPLYPSICWVICMLGTEFFFLLGVS